MFYLCIVIVQLNADYMNFARIYDHGYVVCAVMSDGRFPHRFYPLRNFGQHQGDSILFKECDCPSLSYSEIQLLIRNYSNKRVFKRISSKRFIIETNPIFL